MDQSEENNNTDYTRCRNCGTLFTAEKAIHRVFCSKECSIKYVSCSVCGRYFPGIGEDDNKPRFCSLDCAEVYRNTQRSE